MDAGNLQEVEKRGVREVAKAVIRNSRTQIFGIHGQRTVVPLVVRGHLKDEVGSR